MKFPTLPLILFYLLFGSAIFTGLNSYQTTREHLIMDMNQALEKALALQQEAWITPDTITNYRQHLQTNALREESFVYYASATKAPALRSQPIAWKGGGKAVAYQSYAPLSMASMLSLTDLRLSSLLLLGAFGCALFSLLKRRPENMATILLPVETPTASNAFAPAILTNVHLTPMQRQLMEMFLQAEGHHLSKQEICDHLWPKKDDASETLYTLIRRLKPIVETNFNLKIVAQRGGGYTLQEKD